MMHRIGAILLAVCLLIPTTATAGITLKGKVVLVGAQDELTSAEGIIVILEG